MCQQDGKNDNRYHNKDEDNLEGEQNSVMEKTPPRITQSRELQNTCTYQANEELYPVGTKKALKEANSKLSCSSNFYNFNLAWVGGGWAVPRASPTANGEPARRVREGTFL